MRTIVNERKRNAFTVRRPEDRGMRMEHDGLGG